MEKSLRGPISWGSHRLTYIKVFKCFLKDLELNFTCAINDFFSIKKKEKKKIDFSLLDYQVIFVCFC